jgi:hypothetical protein
MKAPVQAVGSSVPVAILDLPLTVLVLLEASLRLA